MPKKVDLGRLQTETRGLQPRFCAAMLWICNPLLACYLIAEDRPYPAAKGFLLIPGFYPSSRRPAERSTIPKPTARHLPLAEKLQDNILYIKTV